MHSEPKFPDTLPDESALCELLTRPRPQLVEFIRSVPGPIVVLGAGGKMGPTLCVLAKRAAEMSGHHLAIIAASRFTDPKARAWLEERGIETVTADLLDRDSVRCLPESENLINLTGLKFGTAQNPGLTWATNTLAPALVAERYSGARIVALSTGNVYPLVPVKEGGATEEQPLTPLGEYANAAVARERIFEYFSLRDRTPTALIRLNFAVELRYGVLVDIARRVWEEQPIEVGNGWFNCVWQGDANDMILRALDLASSPATAWNLTYPRPLGVRDVARQFGERFGKPPRFSGVEASDAFLSNPRRICDRLGPPATPPEQVIEWIAGWIESGGVLWNKQTGFEVRNGSY